jgi:hypothetical protein
MTNWICRTCGVEHPGSTSPPAHACRICADERQYVPEAGQVWTTLDELAIDGHRLVHEELEPGIHRLNREPEFGIGSSGIRRTTLTTDWPPGWSGGSPTGWNPTSSIASTA